MYLLVSLLHRLFFNDGMKAKHTPKGCFVHYFRENSPIKNKKNTTICIYNGHLGSFNLIFSNQNSHNICTIEKSIS
jgi:hypothetical protein